MELRAPKAILFDIGGTLLREESYGLNTRSLEGWLTQAGHRRPGQAGEGDEESSAAALEELEASIERVHRENKAEFRVADSIGQQFESVTAKQREQLEVEMFEQVAKLSVMPDVAQALATLTTDRIPMGAVSNAVFGAGSLRAELARQGLLAPLRFVVSSAD